MKRLFPLVLLAGSVLVVGWLLIVPGARVLGYPLGVRRPTVYMPLVVGPPRARIVNPTATPTATETRPLMPTDAPTPRTVPTNIVTPIVWPTDAPTPAPMPTEPTTIVVWPTDPPTAAPTASATATLTPTLTRVPTATP